MGSARNERCLSEGECHRMSKASSRAKIVAVSRMGAMALVNRKGALVKIADAEKRLRWAVCGHRGHN